MEVNKKQHEDIFIYFCIIYFRSTSQVSILLSGVL